MQLQDSLHSATNLALFCGTGITDRDLRDRIVGVGLYHWILFSGLHLVLLERWLLRGRKRSLAGCLMLGVFALISGWPGRVVRSLVRLSLPKHRASPLSLIMSSWLLCMAIHPQWIHSLSLHLSALAALAFLGIREHESLLRRAWRVFLWLSPLMAGWAPVHPLIPVLGFLLAPIFVPLWWAEALIEFVNPHGWLWLSRIDDHLQILLVEASHLHPPEEKLRLLPSQWGWFYVLLVFLFRHAWQVHSLRQKQRALR